MGFVHCHLVFLFAMALVLSASCRSLSFGIKDKARSLGIRGFAATKTCKGRVGDCIDESEEMMLGSEANRRVLAQTRYISYDALKRNNVPCNRRGASYYNCASHKAVNPYARGCTRISMCARNTL